MPFWRQDRSVEELEEETERTSAELTLEQKKIILAKLRQENLSLQKSFGGSWRAAWNWVKGNK